MSCVSPLVIQDPTDVINGIKHIVGHANVQFPMPEQTADKEAAIDRRIYRLITAALKLTGGYIDLNRAHEKYLHVIQRAFRTHPNEIAIYACHHMEANPDNNNRSGLLEPFYIQRYMS